MIRTAVCNDDSPTLLYTERFLTKGKTYHVLVEAGPGGLVKVLDPDPILVYKVETRTTKVKTQFGYEDEPKFTVLGIEREEKREPIRCSAERFTIQPAIHLAVDDMVSPAMARILRAIQPKSTQVEGVA